jgi:hypothetical protein
VDAEFVAQKMDLRMKGPLGHVFIKIIQIGVDVIRFKKGFQAVVLAEKFHETAFAHADVARDDDVFFEHPFCLVRQKCGGKRNVRIGQKSFS